ncbi:MAG: hypothetical protein K0R51_503 [Cytophagaceae bacterium]|jgi:hypothetical protein|nr:hypothetical protein [Cytophagaceae bacterium]
MKNKLYPFLLGLSCIVIVALVSFKNSEKAVEKEQMIITVQSTGDVRNRYIISVHTASKTEKEAIEFGKDFNLKDLLSKIQDYTKQGWEVIDSGGGSNYIYYYSLEREKQ